MRESADNGLADHRSGTDALTERRFDLAPATPQRSLLIAATPRSGSTNLCMHLWADGRFGLPMEYFDFSHTQSRMVRLLGRSGARTEGDLLRWLMARRTGPNGTISAKVMIEHALLLLHAGVLGMLPAVQVVRIVRRDVVRQAVSFAKADVTQAWDSTQQSRRAPTFDFWAIHRRVTALVESDALWRRLLAEVGLEPVTVVHEEFVAAPRQTIERLAVRLGLPSVAPSTDHPRPPVLTRQSGTRDATWRLRYLDEATRHGLPLPHELVVQDDLRARLLQELAAAMLRGYPDAPPDEERAGRSLVARRLSALLSASG